VLSIGLLTAVVVGGLGSLTGALLGSALLVFLPPAITDVGTSIGLDDVQAAQLAPLVYGAVLVLVMLLAPSGAVGIAKRLVPGFGRGRGLRGRSSRDHHSTRRS
jgi:branched-chain amino acid transport system permease protein